MEHCFDKKSEFEFDKLENNFNDIYASDGCVEFPPFWPKNEIDINGGLSFIQPNIEKTPSTTKQKINTVTEPSIQQSKDDENGASTNQPIDELSSKVVNNGQSHDNVDVVKCDEKIEKDFANTDDIKKNVKDQSVANGRADNSTIKSRNETGDIKRNDSQELEKTEQQAGNGSSSEDTCCKSERGGSDKPQKGKIPLKASWAGIVRNKEQPVKSVKKAEVCEQSVQENKEKTDVEQATGKASIENSSQTPVSPTCKENDSSSTITIIKPEDDPNADTFAGKLLHMNLIFKPQAFIPRGLINTSNWCYVNATLQALLVCPPFYQLLKSLLAINPDRRIMTSTPIMDSFIQLASEYRPLSTKRGYQSNKEVRQGPPFQPNCIYDMLTIINSSLSEKGRQEDAEEFLSCILNGIHDEITQLLQNHNKGISAEQNQSDVCNGVNGVPQDDVCDSLINGNSDDVNEWEEVGRAKRNRSSITRRANVSKTPISEMFRGELCTTVFRPGRKSSVSYEPFFSLPLDVPCDHAWTVDNALHSLTEQEIFVENDSESDAFRQQTIEILPPVLILHLKRFVYDKNGGSKKIDKKVEFKTDLVVGKELLSKSSRKYSMSQRSYKLFAVVYHHGDKMTGGHYTTDVFNIGLSSWLRIDDQKIWAVPRNEVVKHNSNRTAYLLYYRRTDLG